MSRNTLRRALAGYNAEALTELILDAYDAKEVTAREYFEYFVKPDESKLCDKIEKALRKEFVRTKWGNAKFRVTVVRKQLRLAEIFAVTPSLRLDMMVFVLVCGCTMSTELNMTDTQQNMLEQVLRDAVSLAERSGLLDLYRQRIEEAISPEYRRVRANHGFLTHLHELFRELSSR